MVEVEHVLVSELEDWWGVSNWPWCCGQKMVHALTREDVLSINVRRIEDWIVYGVECRVGCGRTDEMYATRQMGKYL